MQMPEVMLVLNVYCLCNDIMLLHVGVIDDIFEISETEAVEFSFCRFSKVCMVGCLWQTNIL